MVSSEADIIKETLVKEFPNLQAIYVFGSHATQQQHGNSDFDIALLQPFQHSIGKLDLFNAQESLASRLKLDVDLIDLSTASLVLKFQIISTGKLIYCKLGFNPTEYEMTVMSMYQRFNLERADLIMESAKTGRVYS